MLPHAGCVLGPRSPLLCSGDTTTALSASDGVRDGGRRDQWRVHYYYCFGLPV